MPDLLIPPAIEALFQRRVLPTLEAFGGNVPKKLGALLADGGEYKIWPVNVRRPVPASVLIPKFTGRNYRAQEVVVRFPEQTLYTPEDPVRIESVYGVSAVAIPIPKGSKLDEAWQEHRLLAIEVGMLTFLAEILPGHDVFVAVEVWANSLLPMLVLARRPLNSTEFGDADQAIRLVGPDAFAFITACITCKGDGHLGCRKCDNTGRWQPAGYCKRCVGAGTEICPKRKNSSRCIGQYGEVLSFCRSCSGTGRITCRKCGGSGEPPIFSCDLCGGTGHVDCFSCNGEGTIVLSFFPSSGEFVDRGKPVSPKLVFAVDTNSRNRIPLEQGAGLFLTELGKRAELAWSRERELRNLQLEIGRIDGCLERAMQATRISGAEVGFRVRLAKPRSSTSRQKGRHVLEFPILGRPPWLKRQEEPIKAETPLLFLHDEGAVNAGGNERPEARAQLLFADPVSGRPRKDLKAEFVGVTNDERGRFLLVSLPVEVGPEEFPESLWIKADVIRPSELTQQRELALWCKPRESPGILDAIIPNAERKSSPPPKVKPISAKVRDNPAQRQALDLIMSEEPLVLVKGPPGTGKTTLITEVVLQCIERGKRVLVCSETHQAVSNVLGKLHENGGIRMVRHAREENSNLSDLERRYLEGGSGHEFLDQARGRVRQVIRLCQETGTSFDLLLKLLQNAQAAAVKLAEIRDDLDNRTSQARSGCELTVDGINRNENSEIARIEKDYTEQKQKREWEIQEIQKRINKLTGLRDKAHKGRDKAAVAFRKKTGKEPEWTPSQRKDWKIDLSGLVPYLFMDPALIADYWSRYEDERTRAEREISEHQGTIKTTEAEIGEIVSRLERESAALREAARKAKESATSLLEDTLKKLSNDRSAAEAELRPPQKLAAEEWERSVFSGDAGEDDPVAAWGKRLDETVRAIDRNAEEAEFFRRWQLAMESAMEELTELFWQTCQVFLSTCVGLGSWRSFHSRFGKDGVELAIIDEAAHATLTQSLMPMGRAKRVVLIGDEMQLPPAAPMEMRDDCSHECSAFDACPKIQTTGSPKFKPPMSSCWLERSAFEWLMETAPHVPRVMLNQQFRMHPDIADFVAEIFYDQLLENGVTAAQRKLSFGEFTKSVCLISTSNYEDRQEEAAIAEGTSYRNSLEVHLVERVLRRGVANLKEDTEFGIVTPYKAQKELLVAKLGDYLRGQSGVKLSEADIASVDSFQGSERDVMIASFVRSPKTCNTCEGSGLKKGKTCPNPKCLGKGFEGSKLRWVHDLRRLNVAFSRARKMLILIGDIKVLTDPRFGTSEGSEVLGRFRDHVSDRGKVVQVWEEATHG